jgi:hypothetical protein
MSLLEQAQGLTERLKRAERARASIEEAHALEQLRLELSEKSESINALKQRISLLRTNGVPLVIPPSVTSALTKVMEARGKFEQAPQSRTLRSGRRWTSLIDAVDNVSTVLAQALIENWKNYFSSALFGGAPPDQVRARLAMTPQNQNALARYSELFRRFAAFRAKVPSTQSEFDDVLHCSSELETIRFIEDVPESVRTFFETTATARGAGLELLLPEVWQWLRENKLLEAYVVKARISGGAP